MHDFFLGSWPSLLNALDESLCCRDHAPQVAISGTLLLVNLRAHGHIHRTIWCLTKGYSCALALLVGC